MTKKQITNWFTWAVGLTFIYLGTNGYPDFLTAWKVVMASVMAIVTLAIFIPNELLVENVETKGGFNEKPNPLVVTFRVAVTTAAILWYGVGVFWAVWFVFASWVGYEKFKQCHMKAEQIRNA